MGIASAPMQRRTSSHGGWAYAVIVHPPTNPTQRAFKIGDVMRESRRYLARNREIVRATELLIAAPGEMEERHRSGTWSTARYARRIGRPVIVVLPDGAIE
jgi:hypothetical protein